MRTCTHVALAAVKHLSYTNSFSRFTTYDDCCSAAAANVLWAGGTGGGTPFLPPPLGSSKTISRISDRAPPIFVEGEGQKKLLHFATKKDNAGDDRRIYFYTPGRFKKMRETKVSDAACITRDDTSIQKGSKEGEISSRSSRA